MNTFTKEQLNQFTEDGFLFLNAKDVWSVEDLAQLLHEAKHVESLTHPALMKYYETIIADAHEKKVIQRIENFVELPECKTLNHLLNGPIFLSKISTLFNAIQPIATEAILYKEKINYKLPGGTGYQPHQDVAAGWWQYGQTLHITAYISIDYATKDNGALELLKGEHQKGLIGEQYQELPEEYCAKHDWHLYETAPGDVLFFTSFVPHRSKPNHTNTPRRVLYMTYSMQSEGDFRTQYFKDKRKSFPPDDEREAGMVYSYKI